ncbi:helix-turn-helix domain-containing protein [Nocardiopsis salina]|uniref:helix-turn-helix domain-containing protein n=1 Tax=Nocardiopsis salina TaxID=245836 RepID=UPI000347204D|nr:helix-turn-helix domain-containing protein [Nocardiopsis salina]
MNAALRTALAAAQLTETDVAAHIGVDPKTVRRWLSGTRPYPRHRWAVADLLQVDEDALWPKKSHQDRTHAPAPEYVQRVYAHRWQVPREVWWNLFNSAEQEIGILAYSALFLADDAGMLELLRARAQDGVNIRILLGDPESGPLKQRGEEERIGAAFGARAENALLLFRTLSETNGVEVRTHSTVLYNSIYLTEKRIFVNHHAYGIPAAKSFIIELDRESSRDMINTYAQSFEIAWRNGLQINSGE